MQDVSIPLIYGIIAILAIFLVQLAIAQLNKKSMRMRGIFSAKPSIIIDPNGIDFDQLDSQGLTISDLEESMRTADCFSFADIEYGILETNGQMSFLKRPSDSNVLCLPFAVISAGKIDHHSLKYLKLNTTTLTNLLETLNIKLEDVLVLTLDCKGNVYYQEKYKKFITTTIDMEGYIT